MSVARVPTKQTMGKGTSIGWMGWPAMWAVVLGLPSGIRLPAKPLAAKRAGPQLVPPGRERVLVFDPDGAQNLAIKHNKTREDVVRLLRAPAVSVVAFLAFGTFGAAAAPACMPKVEGPVAFKAPSEIFARSRAPAGVAQEEYFISCTVAGGPYKTLVHVRRPAGKLSGVVMVEPWHPNGSWSLYSKISDYDAAHGIVNVIVAGNPMIVETMVKPANPARYASLTLPGKGARSYADTDKGETTEMEILGQVGSLVKSGGLPGVTGRKVILGGMSQTGGVVRAY